jgi:hypothetical protein
MRTSTGSRRSRRPQQSRTGPDRQCASLWANPAARRRGRWFAQEERPHVGGMRPSRNAAGTRRTEAGDLSALRSERLAQLSCTYSAFCARASASARSGAARYRRGPWMNWTAYERPWGQCHSGQSSNALLLASWPAVARVVARNMVHAVRWEHSGARVRRSVQAARPERVPGLLVMRRSSVRFR